MSVFRPPEGLALLLPHEKAYERIYEINTPKEITEKLLPTILHESLFFPVSMYGHRLFHCSQTLEKDMYMLAEPKLPPKAVFASSDDNYTIKEMLGLRTYRVSGKDGGRILKLEWTERPYNVPRIQGTLAVLQKIKDTQDIFPKCEFFKNVIAFHVAGLFQEKFGYYVTDLYDCNLQDMLYKTLEGRPISRATAFHLAAETLKGIHDVHLVRFMHRDIKPSNFYVGRASNFRKIYIGGLNTSYFWFDKKMNEDDSVLGKVRSINARFQSRHYHTSDPMNPIDDLESWIYMIIYFFNPEKLPWRFVKSERVGYEYKCVLVNGGFNLGEIEYFARRYLRFLNFNATKANQEVDFGFFCSNLDMLALEMNYSPDLPIDWLYDVNKGKNVAAARIKDKNPLFAPITAITDIREDPTKAAQTGASKVSTAVKASTASTASKASKASSKASRKPSSKDSKAAVKDSMAVKNSGAVLKPVKKKQATVEETQASPQGASKVSIKPKTKSVKKKNPVKTEEQKVGPDAEIIPGSGESSKPVFPNLSSTKKPDKPAKKEKKDATKEETKEETKEATEEKEDKEEEGSGQTTNGADMG